MGDMGEYFNDHRKANQEKRAQNRKQSAEILDREGVSFVSKNDGAHLILHSGYDFWPGTGRWMKRGETRRKGFGIKSLLRELGI